MLELLRKPVIVLGLSASVSLPIWWFFNAHAVEAQQGGAPTAPSEGTPTAPALTSVEKHVALRRAGLDARVLAAAGVNSSGASSVAQATAQYLAAHPSALREADAAYASARREADQLLRLIQAGKATQAQVAAYQSAKTTLATAESARNAVLDAIFQAATANLTQQQHALLSTIRANAANNEVPVPYRTVTRSKEEWLQLRDDLASDRISLREGEELIAPVQTRLAAVRADATFASANTALTTNLTSVTAAMNTTLGSPSNH